MRSRRRGNGVVDGSTAVLETRDVTQRCSPSAIIAYNSASRTEHAHWRPGWNEGARWRNGWEREWLVRARSRRTDATGIYLVHYICSPFGHFLRLQSSLINVLVVQRGNKSFFFYPQCEKRHVQLSAGINECTNRNKTLIIKESICLSFFFFFF